jgi:hypothetical protein
MTRCGNARVSPQQTSPLLVANLGHLGDRLEVDAGGRIELSGGSALAELLEAASTWQAIPQLAADYQSRPEVAAARAWPLQASMGSGR